MNDQTIEQEIVACGANVAPRITQTNINDNIASEQYFTALDGAIGGLMVEGQTIGEIPNYQALGQITFCVLVLKNGFKVVGVNEGPVDPANFDAHIGRQYARQKAIDQVWNVMGYALKEKLSAA